MGKQSPRIATALAATLLWVVTGAVSRAAELNSGYIVSNQGALGITRVFDDGQNTVLAFIDLDIQSPQLTGADGKKIKFHQVDNYAVLPGKFDEVRVTTEGNNSGVVRSASIQTPVVGAVPAPTAAFPTGSVVSAATAAVLPTTISTNNGLMAKPERPPAAQTMALSGDMVASVAATSITTSNSTTKPSAGEMGAGAAIGPANSPTAAPALPPQPPRPTWEGKAPTDAKVMLLAWAARAHWTAIWDAGFTFPINSNLSYDGSFEQAVGAHYTAYTDRRRTKTPVCVDLHRSNKTVHVYQPDDSGKCDAMGNTAIAQVDEKGRP
jgi:hypothetical protein